jgi:hypothetical protein
MAKQGQEDPSSWAVGLCQQMTTFIHSGEHGDIISFSVMCIIAWEVLVAEQTQSGPAGL